MVFAQQADSFVRVTAVVAGVVGTFALLYLAMRFASIIQKS